MMTRMRLWLVLMIALVLLSSVLVSSRTMWGIKKKPKDEELEDQMNDVLLKAEKRKGKSSGSSTEQAKKVERKPLSRKRSAKPSPNDFFANTNPHEILAFYKLAIDKFKEIVNSDEFEQYFNKDILEQVIKTMSEQNLNADMMEKIQNVNLDDVKQLKEAILQGVEIAEKYLEEFSQVLNDPTKLAELLEQVPAEYRDMLQAVISGDMSTIRELVLSLPGVDPQQKKMLTDLLDGNLAGLLKTSKDATAAAAAALGGEGVNEFIEAARQNLLSDPDAALASGIPLEALQDPKLFAEFMQNSMNALLNNDDSFAQLNNLFGAAAAEEEEKEVEEPQVVKRGKSKRRVEL